MDDINEYEGWYKSNRHIYKSLTNKSRYLIKYLIEKT